MPIYAYRCADCGHEKDVLQKLSDAPLTQCPACGKSAFSKQVTAAGFQLKGSGWYVTDFRGGNSKSGKSANSDDSGSTAASNASDVSAAKSDDASSASSNSSESAKPASTSSSDAAKPAAGGSASSSSSAA
ncbi:FmdB family regulatory protein [Caballeronia glebae]|uniref:FmdB family regulatory protein n=1 Tax=Caballeronia glebae TaxID=1777143 RepID=A0A157ZA09_9BURK|nr:FmdB family zinc ribbon protein [Caballeronia glebae]SAK42239.1 FmdB family regulatory protein [Caballeronia glebae]